MTTDLNWYAVALARGGHGPAHLARRADASQTRCGLPMRRMQLALASVDSACEKCASTCDAEDARAFLAWLGDESVHAVVTDGPPIGRSIDDVLVERRHVEGIARVLRPGGHLFLRRAESFYLQPWIREAIAASGLESRGSIVRVASAPIERVGRRGDLERRAEFHDLYRKKFEGTVARCLRAHQTGGLRRASAERPFTDVIHTDDRDDFLAQLRRASLPLGVGTIVDPFRLRRWDSSEKEKTS